MSSCSIHQLGPSRPRLLLVFLKQTFQPSQQTVLQALAKITKPTKVLCYCLRTAASTREGVVGGDKSRNSCFLFKILLFKIIIIFFNNDYRKPRQVSGQSFLLCPNNFPPPPQSSPLLSDPNKLLVGGLTVLPQAVF